MSKNDFVDLQMTALSFNPFSWDDSSKAVQSSVTSLELKNRQHKLNMSNLDDDIVMIIPISSSHESSTSTNEESAHLFLKPDQMAVHSYYAELADVPVSVQIGLQHDGQTIELVAKFGSRPSVHDFDHKFALLFQSKCLINKQGDETSCLIAESSVSVVPSKPGLLFIGVLRNYNSTKLAENAIEHSRERRSCFNHKRQKRACVGFKEPPPKGVFTAFVPQYDPSTDLNYTISITQSTCLYWSGESDKWTSDGCKVIFLSTLDLSV